MQEIATVTSKGQVTVPLAIRRALGLEAGDRVSFQLTETEEGGVPVVSVRKIPDFFALAGSIPVPPEWVGRSWEDEREEAWREMAKRTPAARHCQL